MVVEVKIRTSLNEDFITLTYRYTSDAKRLLESLLNVENPKFSIEIAEVK